MAVIHLGEFVRSAHNDLGVGKLRQIAKSAVSVEYFVGPGLPPRLEKVAASSISRVTLDCETRVYEPLPNGTGWRAGRALAENQSNYLVQFPNAKKIEFVPAVGLFTRCDLSIPDPSAFLAARVTETPLWQERRAAFVKSLIEQRGACAGMTGLLSSCIDLEPHQIEVVRRVLQDPVQRYLLADEVGLGKTIEAGVVVRQYVLENPADHGVLVLVPPHLERQWRTELTQRFGLGPFLDDTVHVLPHDGKAEEIKDIGLVVIDEAHQLARWAAAGGKLRRRFDLLSKRLTDPHLRLLLLSATPTLHSDEVGFQALLHLLDPVVYPLGDLTGFRKRLQRHETVAQLYHLFRPDEEGSYLEGALDQLLEAFPSDARLKQLGKELRPRLAYGADPDAPERAEGVRAVRAHVSEAYRLHRRLLRNRRADERVEGLLPGRAGIELWSYRDPAAADVAKLLDEWRTAAVAATKPDHAEDYGRVFALFAEAAACDPAAFAALAATRQGEDVLAGLTPPPDDAAILTDTVKFKGEAAILAKIAAIGVAGKPLLRIEKCVTELGKLLAEQQKVPTRAVVFASYPHVADAVFNALDKRWQGAVLRHGQPGWQFFRTSESFRVLVCDRAAEEGLNLHGRGTVLIHFDLPWSPNRVEQRIGRLDRFGVGTPVRSIVLANELDELAAAWTDYLDRGYRAFDRSVAALQYLTENELAALYPAVLADGAAAVEAATEKLAGPEGLVETALKEIQVLDELDAVEAPPGHERFADDLRQADDSRRVEWQNAAHTWVGETLQFARRFDGGPESGVWRYQFQRPRPSGPSTLMPVERLSRQFSHVIDTEDDRSTPLTPLTYPMSFDRRRAQNRRAALARIGDPFMDAMVRYVYWDDRGACSALWRVRPKAKYAKPAEVGLRFEFVVECPIEKAIAACGVASANQPLRRQADWLFPPFPISVWLDQDLKPITNAAKLAVLAEPYSKARRFDGGRDFNLNAGRWAALGEHFPRAKWAKLVEKARAAAEKHLRGTDGWEERVVARLDAARRDFADRDAQTASRLAFLTGKHQTTEKARAKVDRAVADALLAGVEKPSVRLDSVAAVFLANWNPFTDGDE